MTTRLYCRIKNYVNNSSLNLIHTLAMHKDHYYCFSTFWNYQLPDYRYFVYKQYSAVPMHCLVHCYKLIGNSTENLHSASLVYSL
ncbi:Uncharacterised protein [Segatella copri]|nr:Uncharacterised protein [Segatella copri]